MERRNPKVRIIDSKGECWVLYIQCLVTHLFLLLLFWKMHVMILAYYNIACVLFYLIESIHFSKKEQLGARIFALNTEIVLHGILCNIFLGWGYGFFLYVLMFIPITFFLVYLDEGKQVERTLAIIFAILEIAALVLSMIIRGSYNRIDYVKEWQVATIMVVNMALCGIALLRFSYSFLNEINGSISILEKRNTELHFRATHDDLTKMYTRKRFYEEAEELLHNYRGETFCMINLDIKDFKLVNELFGDKEGDHVLVSVAEILDSFRSEKCTSGRIGGDNFAICMPWESFDEKGFIEKVKQLDGIFGGTGYHMQIYAGVYIMDDPSEPIGTACDKAMVAIRKIKGDYSRTIAYYDSEILEDALVHQQYINEFERALGRNEFCVYLQPQTDHAGRMYGAEALVRWNHPLNGIMLPGVFIEHLEEAGLLYRLDIFVWEYVGKKLREWKDMGREDLYISVNISRRDFYYMNIYETIMDIVKRNGIRPQNFRLEVTETTLSADFASDSKALEQLRKEGFLIEIDDFGSGYSTLNMLKEVSADVIKVDRNFLRETDNAERSRIILKSVMELAGKLGMAIVVEGVEQTKQVDMLSQMGCNRFQGYYFSKPIPVEEFEKLYLQK